ncbi:MAG: glycosyltransferase family 39 protein [Eubacteriales bacterium]
MKKIEEMIEEYGSHLIGLMIIGITVIYCSLMFSPSIWTDEAFTLQLITENMQGITLGTANDVHPPLYYYLVKLPTYLAGKNLIVLKIFSIVPMILTYILLAVKVTKYYGKLAAFLAVLFLASIPCSMEFSVQVRMYSLALLCVTGSGIYAYEFWKSERKNESSENVTLQTNKITGIKEEKNCSSSAFVISPLQASETTGLKYLIPLILFSVGAAYTHYFAFVSIIAVNGFLFLALLFSKRSLLLKHVVAIIMMFILYIPWIPYFIEQVTNVTSGYWIPEITKSTVWGYLTWTFGLSDYSKIVYVFLAIVIMLLGVAIYKKQVAMILAFLIPVITAAVGLVASLLTEPIYREQYWFPALGLFSVFVGVSVKNLICNDVGEKRENEVLSSKQNKEHTVNRCNKVLLVTFTVFLLFVAAIQYKECFIQEYRSNYAQQTIDLFASNVGENDYVLYNWEAFGFIYKEQFPEYQLEYSETFDYNTEFETCWLMGTSYQNLPQAEMLAEKGLVMESVGIYGIEHNDFEVYKIYKWE